MRFRRRISSPIFNHRALRPILVRPRKMSAIFVSKKCNWLCYYEEELVGGILLPLQPKSQLSDQLSTLNRKRQGIVFSPGPTTSFKEWKDCSHVHPLVISQSKDSKRGTSLLRPSYRRTRQGSPAWMQEAFHPRHTSVLILCGVRGFS